MRLVHLAPLALVACSSAAVETSSPAPASSEEQPPAVVEPGGSSPAGTLACPKTGAVRVPGKVSSAEIAETSGIVASTRNPGVYWVHNDSGDVARAFALGADGALLATLTFDDETPTDIEDMTIEDDANGGAFLYFGDIGDNDEERASVTIFRVAEPKLGSAKKIDAASEKMTVVYADGPHNAETLVFDPRTRDLLIATKKTGGPSAVHRVGPFSAGASVTTTQVAAPAVDLATGGQISRDGRLIAIRNYSSAMVWTRAAGESIANALARTPCTYPIAAEKQGEAFAFLPGNDGFVTLSEGKSPELHLTPFE